MPDSTWRSTAMPLPSLFSLAAAAAAQDAGRLLVALALGGAGGFVSDAKVTLRCLIADPAPATADAFVFTPEAALPLPAAGVADGLSAGGFGVGRLRHWRRSSLLAVIFQSGGGGTCHISTSTFAPDSATPNASRCEPLLLFVPLLNIPIVANGANW